MGVYGVTGADPEGDSIRRDLDGEGIDTSLIALDHRHTTNASTALVFRGERTLFVCQQARSYHLPELPRTAWIYATSVGPRGAAVNRLHKALHCQIERNPWRLAFSPGTHQLRMSARALSPLLKISHLLLLNRHKARELTHADNHPKALLQALHRLGPKTVVMTDGTHGSCAFDGDVYLRTGVLPVPVVDRAGAGDGYGATVMVALQLGRPLAVAMAWGPLRPHMSSEFSEPRRACCGVVGCRRRSTCTRSSLPRNSELRIADPASAVRGRHQIVTDGLAPQALQPQPTTATA